jgi:putative ABC transport system permease protein
VNSMRYLLRRMSRSVGFSVTIVVTIALAVGVNLGVFSITRSILFNSLGVPNAEKLLYFRLGSGADATSFSGPGYEALRADGTVKDLLAWKPTQFQIQTRNGMTPLFGAIVTGNTFSVLGLKPYLGRFFNESDDASGGGRDGWAAVLGYTFWKTHFEASPNVIGQTILVDGAPVHIVGVLPRNFAGMVPVLPTGILLPRHFTEVDTPGRYGFDYPGILSWYVFGRLPNGTSIQNVQANLRVIEPTFRRQADPEGTVFSSTLFSNTASGALLRVQDGRHGATSIKSSLLSLFIVEGLAGAVFLLCCCNLILLFLARARREAQATVIRMALGARRINEVSFAMLEAAVLTAAGCLISVPIIWGIVRGFALLVQSFIGIDVFSIVAPSPAFILTAIGVVLAVGCGIGACASLWQGRNQASLRLTTGAGVTAKRSKNLIISFEVFASLLLISSVIVGSIGFRKLASQPSGFAAVNAVTASLDFVGNSHGGTPETIKAEQSEKTGRILERIEAAPGVQSVATMNMPPLGGGVTASAEVEVRGEDGTMREQKIWNADVSTRYFAAIGTGIIRGRDFTKDDLAGDPVCILSNRASSALFSKDDPLGKYLYQSGDPATNTESAQYCRVVGIAEDAHFKSMSDPADPVVYLLTKGAMSTLVVRAATSELAIQAVRNAVQAVDPVALVSTIDTIETRIDADLRVQRAITISGMICAGIAAMILEVGFFGILSLQIAERRREIGIQVALGASRLQVCVSVMKKLRRALLVGLVSGSATGLLAATALAQVYSLNARFVVGGYLCSLFLLGVLLLAAAAVPLRRALTISPMECLASE